MVHCYEPKKKKQKVSEQVVTAKSSFVAYTVLLCLIVPARLLITFANSLEPDQATKQWAWSGSKLFATLISLLKYFFLKYDKVSWTFHYKSKNSQRDSIYMISCS